MKAKIVKKSVALCPYCIEAILSRGEKLYIGENCERENTCEWCDYVYDEEENELKNCIFC